MNRKPRQMRALAAVIALLALIAAAQAVPLASVVESAPHLIDSSADNTPAVCEKCKDLAGQLQDTVKNLNATYAGQIQKFMDENICAQIPAEDRKKCREAVEQQLPAVWDAVIQNLEPTELCAALHLCDAGSPVIASPVDCQLCKEVAKAIDKKVFQNPKAIQQIEAELDHVCQELPNAAEQKKCQEDVDKNLPAVMKEIGDMIAGELCVDAGLCKK